jgi:hypothetical protein
MPVRSNLDAIRVVAPKPLNAVAGAPATNGGNLKGQPYGWYAAA